MVQAQGGQIFDILYTHSQLYTAHKKTMVCTKAPSMLRGQWLLRLHKQPRATQSLLATQHNACQATKSHTKKQHFPKSQGPKQSSPPGVKMTLPIVNPK